MTRLNEKLIERFEFLEECREGLEMIPDECGRKEYLELHDHLVKSDTEVSSFRSHMERLEPSGLTVEAFTIPIYLDTVYNESRKDHEAGTPEAWDEYMETPLRWEKYWEHARERGTAASERYATIADSAQRRGISATATFTNSYQLAAPRVEQEMFDRAYEVLSEEDAESLRGALQRHAGDPLATRRAVENALVNSDASAANRAYLLSVVSEYDIPGSALTREQANASYHAPGGALTRDQVNMMYQSTPAAPAWPQAQTPQLDGAHQAPSMTM